MEMFLFYYKGPEGRHHHSDFQFVETVRSMLPRWRVSTFFSMQQLFRELRAPHIFFRVVIVLNIQSEDEIDAVSASRELFTGIETIIVLENEAEAMMARCYRLQPRLVLLSGFSPMLLLDVLRKMANRVDGQVRTTFDRDMM